jgi:hypothetical protein
MIDQTCGANRFAQCSFWAATMLIPEEGLHRLGERYNAGHGYLRGLGAIGLGAQVIKQVQCYNLR